jgi:hypothetical protein
MFQMLLEDQSWDWKPNIPRWGYRKAWKSEWTGAQMLALQKDASVKPVLVLSGHSLNVLADIGGCASKFELASKAFSGAAGASRIDIAVDIYDGGSSAWSVAAMAEGGHVETSAKKITVMKSQGQNAGVTTYFGARTSPKMIRVYSKPLPGDKLQFFTRIEIEIKKRAAQEIWDKFIKDPPPPPLSDVLAIIKTVVSEFKTPLIDRVMLESAHYKFSGRETTDTTWQEWLSRQVVPMLKRDYKLGRLGSSKLEWLINEVTEGKLEKAELCSCGGIKQSSALEG